MTIVLQNFKIQAKLVAKLFTEARRNYFRNLITDNKTCPKRLWSTLNSLLHRSSEHTLPSTTLPQALASDFMTFKKNKITLLNSSLPNLTTSPHVPIYPVTPPTLSEFSAASEAEVRTAILSASNSTCSLDYIPTKILKSCLPVLLTPITKLINLCLAESCLPSDFMHAVITPILKKDSLSKDVLSNY